MSGREWRPGDVALIDGRYVALVWDDNDAPHGRLSFVYTDKDDDPCSIYVNPDADARPLLVIDPESEDDRDRLAKALVEAMYAAGQHACAANGVHPDTVAVALRSLIAPPKPPEPTGLGAVVEDAEGAKWVRGSSMRGLKAWTNDEALDSEWRSYRDIDAVRVLSEGVTS